MDKPSVESSNTVEPQKFFAQLMQGAEAMPQRWQHISARIRLTILGAEGGSWLVDASRVPAVQVCSLGQSADCLLEMSAEQFVEMVSGQQDLQTAFRSGDLRVAGSLEAALQCNLLFELIQEKERPA